MSNPSLRKLMFTLILEDPKAIDIVENIPDTKRSEIISKYIILGDMVISHALIGTRKETVEEFFSPLKGSIELIQEQLKHIIPTIAKSHKKGEMTEKAIFKSLQEHFLDDSFQNVSTISRYTDILATLSDKKIPILIELKDYKYTVPATEINKFWNDMERRNASYGVFISMRSGIAKCSGCINIKTNLNRTAVFVVNDELNWTGHVFAFQIIKRIAELEITKMKELKGDEIEKTFCRINKICLEIQKTGEIINTILDIANNLRTTNQTRLDEIIDLAQKYKVKMNSKITEVFDELDRMESSPEKVSTPEKFYSNSGAFEQKKAYNVAEIRKEHERAYEKWTEAEDLELTIDYQAGLSKPQLAEKHKRKQGAIHSRLKKLGLEQ